MSGCKCLERLYYYRSHPIVQCIYVALMNLLDLNPPHGSGSPYPTHLFLVPPQALSAQQANKLAHSRGPPFWAVLAILVLGWNEFMALLWNPLYLMMVCHCTS